MNLIEKVFMRKIGFPLFITSRFVPFAAGSPLLTNLEAYWAFDETSGTNVADSTGNGHDGTATGTTAGVTGIISNGRQFTNNTSDVVTVAHNSSLMSPSFSISLWVYITSDSAQYVRLLEKGGAASTDGYGLEWNGVADRLAFVIWNGSYAQSLFSPIITMNAWTHVACIFDGSNSAMYINGGSLSESYSVTMGTNTHSLLFGKYEPDNAHTLDGTLCEIGYWSRTITAGEVTQLYNSGAALAYPFA
jgi:hypothetical protein